MSVIVSCNLADGVILGVDSAITLPGPAPVQGQPLPPNVMHGGVLKVYEDADKLFPLGLRPIGVATFASAVIGNRTVGNYLREFVASDPNGVVSGHTCLQQIATELSTFINNLYTTIVVPAIEQARGVPFAQIPADQRPAYGFVIGGFSWGAHLSEVWSVIVPLQGATEVRGQGNFNANWWALFEPISRYIQGYSPSLMAEVKEFFAQLRGQPLSVPEEQQLQAILNKHEALIPVGVMPVNVGVEYVRFLVDLVVKHHKFAIGASVVGGRSRIGKVTHMSSRFEILE